MRESDSFSIDFDESDEWGFNRRQNPSLDPPLIRVYLASALTNLDDAARAEAREVRRLVRQLFEDYEYEGIRFTVYDPGEVTSPGSGHSADQVYQTDHYETSCADLMVFYVAAPSLGAGMEAQISADCTLPRVVISRRDLAVSRMFSGLFCPTIASIQYADLYDLGASLRANLAEIARSVIDSAHRRRKHLAEFDAEQLGAKVLRQRLLRGISLAELARATDIRETWLARLERIPCLAASLTLIALHRIAAVLKVTASISPTGVPTLKPHESDGGMTAGQRDSLSNLVEFARTRTPPPNDATLLRMWQDYRCQQPGQIPGALGDANAACPRMTLEDWEGRYEQSAAASPDVHEGLEIETMPHGPRPEDRPSERVPQTRQEIRTWLREQARVLLPHVRRQVTTDMEPIVSFIESLEPSARNDAFADLRLRFDNEASLLSNNIKVDQVLEALRQKWARHIDRSES